MAEWRLDIKNRNGARSLRPDDLPNTDDMSNFPAPPASNDFAIKKEPGKKEKQRPPDLKKLLLLDVADGASCNNCRSCSGFNIHPWRKICNNCRCEKDEHDCPVENIINTYKMNRMSLHESGQRFNADVSNDDYIWAPPGLSEKLVEKYMNSLPNDKIPRLNNPDGIKYHNRQLVYQLPLQDSNFDNCRYLDRKQKHHHDSFKRERERQMSTGIVKQASERKVCHACKEVLSVGALLVHGDALGEDAVFHPACFTCHVCHELLADLIYCHKDARVFCARHYAEQLKPRCCMCDELIFAGEYIRTDDRAYHSEHFVCCNCERGLSGEQHLVDQGFPICITCYDDKYASICHMCGKTIGVDEEDVIYDDEHWHDSCLVCALCSARLSGTSFVIRDDQFVCSECYQRTDDKRCKNCGKGFEPGAKRLELKGVFWHDTCFTCDICKCPITSRRFIHHDGKQVCCDCFDNNYAKSCAKCSKILREGGVSCGGDHFHRECFTCSSCNESIATQAFQQKEGKRFCTPCYKERYAKVCAACGDFIITGEFYTLDADNWHKECFRCEKCHVVLLQQSFTQENGKIRLICEACQ